MEYKIEDLTNVLNGSDWSITARVLKKSDILTYDNGNGKRFETILSDKTSKIRAVAFGEDVDRLFSHLEENNVYNIKNGVIKEANKKFTNDDYDITFNGSTVIEKSGITDIPSRPSLKTIENVFSMDLNTLIDTIGVIIKIEQFRKIKTEKSTAILRNITLEDRTRSVTVTLWDTQATNLNANEGDIMSIIRGKIMVFKSVKKICVTTSSKVEINPSWNETLDLQNWYKEFEKKKLLNPSQVSIGSQELNMFEISQSNRNKTEYEHVLQQNKVDDDLISKRLLELNDEEYKIKTERADLSFKKRRLSIERESIKSHLES